MHKGFDITEYLVTAHSPAFPKEQFSVCRRRCRHSPWQVILLLLLYVLVDYRPPKVSSGDPLGLGLTLVVLGAMKMEHTHTYI